MKNIWTDQQIIAVVEAEKAAIHYQRSGEYYEAGNPEKEIHHALYAVKHIDHSRGMKK